MAAGSVHQKRPGNPGRTGNLFNAAFRSFMKPRDDCRAFHSAAEISWSLIVRRGFWPGMAVAEWMIGCFGPLKPEIRSFGNGAEYVDRCSRVTWDIYPWGDVHR
jgi:hypothetical protein